MALTPPSSVSIRQGTAAGGDLGGTFPSPTVNPFANGFQAATQKALDGLTAETVPKWALSDSAAPTAGKIGVYRVFLKGGNAYTTVTMHTQATAPVTCANVFFGLYDYPAAATRLAVSADLAASLNAIGAFVPWAAAFAVTPAADAYYWLAFLIGSAGTLPTFRMAGQMVADMAPLVADDTAAAGHTSLPTSLTLTASGYFLHYARLT